MISTLASPFGLWQGSIGQRTWHADVAKLVDARDLKSLGLGHAGSIPAVRTIVTAAAPAGTTRRPFSSTNSPASLVFSGFTLRSGTLIVYRRGRRVGT